MSNSSSEQSEPLNEAPTPSATSEITFAEPLESPSTEISTTEPTPKVSTSPTATTLVPTSENSRLPVGKNGTVPAAQALGAFERHAGSRQHIASRIGANTLSPQEATFVDLLLDPSRSGDTLGALAVQAGIDPYRVLDLFRKGAIAEAAAISVAQISDALPLVVRDVIDNSYERNVPCPCIKDGKPKSRCKRCFGTGLWIRESDPTRQQMVYEQAGLIKRGGGLTIQQGVNVGVQSGPSGWSMDKFVKNTDQNAYDVKPGDIVDAEVVPAKE